MPKRIIDLDTIVSLAGNDYFIISDSNDGNLSKKVALQQITDTFDGVGSVFGRTGFVVATVGDYTASEITNNSNVTGSYVSDALNTLNIKFTQTTVLTVGTSWTPAITGLIQVTLVGGGAGGGGAGNTDSSSNGAGGNSGEVLSGYLNATSGIAITYSIGAGGTGGVGYSAGTSGGNTSFGTLQANGGSPGRSAINGESAPAQGIEFIKNSFVPSSALQVVSYAPSQGALGGYYDGSGGLGGSGGNAIYGTGGSSVGSSSNGNNATGYGAGGGGAFDGSTDKTGGSGSPGVIVIKY